MSSKQKKILHLITKSNYGGAQVYVYDLATEASKANVVSVAFGGAGRLKEKLDAEDIQTIPLKNLEKSINPFTDIFALFEIIKILRTERPDVLHISSSKAGILGTIAGKITGVQNIIFTSHGLVFEEKRGVIASTVLRFITWLTFALSHKIILMSEANKIVADKMPFIKNKTTLIHNSPAEFKILNKEIARDELVKMDNKLNTENVWVGTVSELTENKGLVPMLRAIKEVVKNNKEISFIIFGDGDQKPELLKLISDLEIKENVHLLGYVKDASQYLSALDIFTLTSFKEGHPYALLEAATVGLPVIASSIPGITDIIDDGATGLLVDPADISSITTAIDTYITKVDLRDEQALELNKSVTNKFSHGTMIDSTLSLY